jgi:adenine/guanine/hypoxanthine permease
MRRQLERYFEFDVLGTDWRTEILAGVTTFVTMAYIIFVNPSILQDAGMPFRAVVAATCLSAGLGSVMMGAFARYPIALAPGMGLNAYFTYVVVKGLGVSWPVALGAVFLSGVIFVLLTLAGVRQMIMSAIPRELFAAVASGIGLFIALIGLKNSGLIVANPATLVSLGSLHDGNVLLALFGLIVTAALLVRKFRAAMLVGVVATTVAGAAVGLVQWNPQSFSFSEMAATAFQLDIPGAMSLGILEIVFVFLFVDLFDNIGTLMAVGKKARLFDNDPSIPRLNRILFTDATATMAGALAGTSTVVSYVESAAGVVAGGRSGVTAIVTGILFLLALFVAPLVGAIPAAATAPALILVGSMMASHMAEIDWTDLRIAIPAFLTVVSIPFTFSIANGIALGFTAYTLLCILQGEFQRVNWLMYVLTGLFIARFYYISAA